MLFFLSVCFGGDGCAGEGEDRCGEGFILGAWGVWGWIHFGLRLEMLRCRDDVGDEWGGSYIYCWIDPRLVRVRAVTWQWLCV